MALDLYRFEQEGDRGTPYCPAVLCARRLFRVCRLLFCPEFKQKMLVDMRCLKEGLLFQLRNLLQFIPFNANSWLKVNIENDGTGAAS